MSARPTTSNADEWQVWLFENAIISNGSIQNPEFLCVQIVEAIEEHQKALAREVYGLAEDTAAKYGASEKCDNVMGSFSRGRITEAKSIARVINAIMPYSRNPTALIAAARENERLREALDNLAKAIQRDEQAWLWMQETPEMDEAFAALAKETP